MKLLQALFAFILLSIESQAHTCPMEIPPKAKAFEEVLQKLIKQHNIPEVGVVLYLEGNIALQKSLTQDKKQPPKGLYAFDPGYRMSFERSLYLREAVKPGDVDMTAPFITYLSAPQEKLKDMPLRGVSLGAYLESNNTVFAMVWDYRKAHGIDPIKFPEPAYKVPLESGKISLEGAAFILKNEFSNNMISYKEDAYKGTVASARYWCGWKIEGIRGRMIRRMRGIFIIPAYETGFIVLSNERPTSDKYIGFLEDVNKAFGKIIWGRPVRAYGL